MRRKFYFILIGLGIALGIIALVFQYPWDQDKDGQDSLQGANVLFILIDALRPDYLATYSDTGTGLNIKKLSDQSFVYADIAAQASCTMPSIPSMLASLIPSKIYPSIVFSKKIRHVKIALPENITLFPEFLRSAGYETVMFNSNPLVSEDRDTMRGLDEYYFFQEPCDAIENYGSAPSILNAALEWLEREDHREPFFMYLHFMDVHTKPCGLEYKTTQTAPGWSLEQQRYKERIAFLDGQLGDFLEGFREQGFEKETLIVLTSDHGEEIGDHGGTRHCQTLFEEGIRIPLIIKPPGLQQQIWVNDPVSALDISPTLLELLEIPVNDHEFDGEILPPFNRTKKNDSAIINQIPRQVALRMGDWKLIDIYHPDEKSRIQYGGNDLFLFNLAEDPMEKNNLKDKYPEKVAEMRKEIERIQGSRRSVPDVPLTPEEEKILKSLGYIE